MEVDGLWLLGDAFMTYSDDCSMPGKVINFEKVKEGE
jgi:hypothetical protein